MHNSAQTLVLISVLHTSNSCARKCKLFVLAGVILAVRVVATHFSSFLNTTSIEPFNKVKLCLCFDMNTESESIHWSVSEASQMPLTAYTLSLGKGRLILLVLLLCLLFLHK